IRIAAAPPDNCAVELVVSPEGAGIGKSEAAAEVDILDDDEPAWAQVVEKGGYHGGWVGQVREQESCINDVEASSAPLRLDVAHPELRGATPLPLGARAGEAEGRPIDVDTERPTARAYASS